MFAKPVHPAGGQSRPPLQGVQRVVVGADDSVGPLGSYEFAKDYRKIGAFRRAEQSPAPTTVVHMLGCSEICNV